jgi:hypothetical protein
MIKKWMLISFFIKRNTQHFVVVYSCSAYAEFSFNCPFQKTAIFFLEETLFLS